MKALILKDISFNVKNIIISFLLSIVGYALLCFEGGEVNKLVAFTLIPILVFNFMIGKLCFIEDRDKVYKYIEALPIKKRDFVLSKFLESIVLVIISFLLICVENSIINIINDTSFTIDIKYIAYSFSLITVYISSFLLLYYKFNYQIANQVLIFFYLGGIFALKFMASSNMEIIKIFNMEYSYIFIVIISMTFLIVSYFTSIVFYKNKER